MNLKAKMHILMIRWALRAIAQILAREPELNYEALEKLGIEDFEYDPDHNNYIIYIPGVVRKRK